MPELASGSLSFEDSDHLTHADREALKIALECADDRFVETALGGFQVFGRAERGRLLLCHGAGAGHGSEFLTQLRRGLAHAGIQVVAVEFGYMARARREGRRRPPPKVDILVAELKAWRQAIMTLTPGEPLWLGGKSMGGRVASHLAARDAAAGLVLCGYPFHPPGKPERLRLGHWPQLHCPLIVLQGTRDPFGRRAEVESYALPTHTQCHFLEGGDHDWMPPKRAPQTQLSLIQEAVVYMARAIDASQ